MPVILPPGDFNRWLERGEAHQPPIDLLRPFPAEEMESFEVSTQGAEQLTGAAEQQVISATTDHLLRRG
jgi:putative SOS response-associated peptidase YedK